MGNLTNDSRRAGRISYEEYERPVSCDQSRPRSGGSASLFNLAGERETRTNPDGSISEGVVRWWVSDSCRSPALDALREAANMARVNEGGELLPATQCPAPDIAGVTCLPKFYPEKTWYRDGSYREQYWVWSPHSDVGKVELHYQVETWNVYFTPDEWTAYQLLQDDNFLRALDPGMATAVYYSLLQWRCAGGITPILDPSVVSPQSLAGKHDTGHQYWLEYWERSLRERLWKIRTDLRSIRLPDGQVVPGLRDPKTVEVRPHCTSSTGKIIMTVFSAVTAIAGLAMSWPSWITLLYDLPRTVADFLGQLKAGKLTAKAIASVTDAQTGTGTGPMDDPTKNPPPVVLPEWARPKPPVTPATPAPDPTGLTDRANGNAAGPATGTGGAKGSIIPLLIILALSAL